MSNNKINIRVEYEPKLIRYCSIQCPNCGKWFWDKDCLSGLIPDSFDLTGYNFKCPVCNHTINYQKISKNKLNIEESNYEEMQKIGWQGKRYWE